MISQNVDVQSISLLGDDEDLLLRVLKIEEDSLLPMLQRPSIWSCALVLCFADLAPSSYQALGVPRITRHKKMVGSWERYVESLSIYASSEKDCFGDCHP